MASQWTIVAKARNDFADMLDGLSSDQLATQSLCDEWSVLDVGGHLVSLVELSKLQMVGGIAKHRGNADEFLSIKAKEFASLGAPALSKILRAKAGQPMKPYSEASLVNDTAVHHFDAARPLGLSNVLDDLVLTTALDFSARELAKKLKDTPVRLEATDRDWSHGDGAIVSGSGEALLLALNARDARSEITGDGIGLLPG